MISADYSMSPSRAAAKPNPFADLAGMRPPRKIADAQTEAAANNAIASGYQKGAVRPGMMSGQGFSSGAQQRMRAAQQQASGVGQGAQQAAQIRSEDQMFNAEQQSAYDQLVQSRLNNNYELQNALNQANFGKRFAGLSNRLNMDMARQQAWQQIRLALLSRME